MNPVSFKHPYYETPKDKQKEQSREEVLRYIQQQRELKMKLSQRNVIRCE